ncbi:MAG: hypothetical protein QHJ73_13610, partial [Armatimonadota bacterium]|nr:hypothetical protein [Armatimonadota bacterium]
EGSDLELVSEAVGLCYRGWAAHLAAWATGPEPGRGFARAARGAKGFHLWDWFQDKVITPKPLRLDPNTCMVPGTTGAQRLGLSGRGTPSGRKLETFTQGKRQMGWIGLFLRLAKPGAPAMAGLPFLQGILAIDLSLYAMAGDTIANVDPPRTDFHLIATPDAPPLPPLPDVPGWSAQRLLAVRALWETAQQLAASLRAAVVSYERHGGAVAAGNADAADRQFVAFLHNQRVSGERMLMLADRLDVWLETLHHDEVPDSGPEPGELQAARDRVRREGLPSDMVDAARQAGFSEEEISTCREFYATFALDEDEEGTFYSRAEALAGVLRDLGVELMAVREPQPPAGREFATP